MTPRQPLTLACTLALMCALGVDAGAERLPATFYRTADGLANDTVNKVLADSRGFIWFGTREGLSRFDGYGFTNYGIDDGLPGIVVNDLIETRSGIYLIATAGGLARLETAAVGGRRPIFSVHQVSADPASRYVIALYESRDAIWVSTRAGLFRTDDVRGDIRFRSVAIGPDAGRVVVNALREDRFRTLWAATPLGLRRLWPDGRVDTHFATYGFHSVLEDRAGHIWAGTRLNGLVEIVPDERSGAVVTTRLRSTSTGFPDDWINELLEPKDGELWATAPGGVIQLTRMPDGERRARLLGDSQGLGRDEFQSLALDRSGNVWAGTAHAGAVRIAGSGFSTFDGADGIRSAASLVQTRAGEVCFIASDADWGLWCFNGISFDLIRTGIESAALTWGWDQIVLQDHTGEWWFATRKGVARMGMADRPQDLRQRLPAKWYRTAETRATSVVLRLFEDSRGDIWIATTGEGSRNGIARWQRQTDSLVDYTSMPNLPDLSVYFPTAFAEDSAGNIWVGFSGNGGIARFRNGTFERLGTGVFPAIVRTIVRDARGRLWVGTYDGLVRVDDPEAVSPSLKRYTVADGLSSNVTTAIVENADGALYLGTGRGVDRLDPESGRVRHYSTRDGYTPGEMLSALRDRRTGQLWFGQQSGVSRLVPPPDVAVLPPPIVITSVEVAGQAEGLNPLGDVTPAALRIAPNRNNLRLEFVALGLGPGEDLRYQYRLEGAGGDWSAPAPQRTVNFANLGPGTYRFLVRAISTDGVVSDRPAGIAFTILRPMWQQSWFVTLAGAAVASLLYGAYRYRLRRVLELAAIRARIAADLHDDIGANLTKIAVLSEVARQRLDGHAEAGDRLSTIARISRESVASMSDVVWAVNPRRDNLRDTIRRMRQHAEEAVAGTGITLVFQARDAERTVRVPIEVRRDFLLVFKEAMTNAVRHASCHTLRVAIGADASQLYLHVADDGVGFHAEAESAGNGLASMRRRASAMHGTLHVTSARHRGTTVSLSVPLSSAGRLRWPA